jgi:hypothetical protein
MIREFRISCTTFGGFSLKVDLNTFNSVDEIIKHVLVILESHLSALNLEHLVEKLKVNKSNYHIHDYELGYILLNDKIYYICNHLN